MSDLLFLLIGATTLFKLIQASGEATLFIKKLNIDALTQIYVKQRYKIISGVYSIQQNYINQVAVCICICVFNYNKKFHKKIKFHIKAKIPLIVKTIK